MNQINNHIKINIIKILNDINNKINLLFALSRKINNAGQIVELLDPNSLSIKTLQSIIDYINILLNRGYGRLNISTNSITIDLIFFNNLNDVSIIQKLEINKLVDYNPETLQIVMKPITAIYNDDLNNLSYLNFLTELNANCNEIIEILKLI